MAPWGLGRHRGGRRARGARGRAVRRRGGGTSGQRLRALLMELQQRRGASGALPTRGRRAAEGVAGEVDKGRRRCSHGDRARGAPLPSAMRVCVRRRRTTKGRGDREEWGSVGLGLGSGGWALGWPGCVHCAGSLPPFSYFLSLTI